MILQDVLILMSLIESLKTSNTELAVFDKNTAPSQYIYSAETQKFSGESVATGTQINDVLAFYPYSANVTCDGTPLEIEVNGDKPDSGSITFDRGRVTGIELTFGERKVVTNSNGELVLGDNTQVCKLISGEANEIGSKYECEVKSGTKYNFYVLSKESDGTTNLIMERNICEDVSFAAALIAEKRKQTGSTAILRKSQRYSAARI